MSQKPSRPHKRVERLKALDTKDPVLVHLSEVMRQLVENKLRGLEKGELEWVVAWTILLRWEATQKPSYAHEIAWVLERPLSSIVKALEILEDEGEIEFAGYGKGKRGLVKKYKPIREVLERSLAARRERDTSQSTDSET
jgi:hypothetical protein